MKDNTKKWLKLVLLCLSGSVIYRLPYLRELYYIPLQQATGVTNAQLGLLMSAYGIANFVLYFPGGWAADRFSTRKLITFSLVTTGITGFFYATFPSFILLIGIHVVWAVTTVFTYWAAAIRIVRLLGDSNEQGKLFGIWTFGRGLATMIFGFISVHIFTKFGENVTGMRATIIFYSIITIVIGILSYLVLEDKVVSEDSSRISIKEMVKILKLPAAWLAGALIFTSWSVYIGFTMITPYLTDIFKMGTALVASTILYASIAFSIGGLLSGFLADKIGSRVKTMLYCFIGMVISTGVYYFIPGDTNLVHIAIINLVFLGVFVFGNQAIFFSVIDEIKIPENATGTAAGLMSFIGYFPEIFCYTMVGKMVDKSPGIVGYRHIFLFMIGCAVLGIISAAILLIKYTNKKLKNNSSTEKVSA